MADPLVEDQVADCGHDEVSRLLAQERRHPGLPVDLLGRFRRLHPPLVDRPPLVPPLRLRRSDAGSKDERREDQARGQA